MGVLEPQSTSANLGFHQQIWHTNGTIQPIPLKKIKFKNMFRVCTRGMKQVYSMEQLSSSKQESQNNFDHAILLEHWECQLPWFLLAVVR